MRKEFFAAPRFVLLTILVVPVICPAQTSANLNGQWHGSWQGRMAALPITLDYNSTAPNSPEN